MTTKPLIGAIGAAALVASWFAPIPAKATLVDRTVYCEEFGFIT